MFFWDYTIFLLIPPFLLALYAQYKVKSTFQNFSKKRAHSRISGAEVAKEILNRSGIGDVSVERISGRLSDHYDPRSKTLRLSENVYSSDSIAALGVAPAALTYVASTAMAIMHLLRLLILRDRR